MSYGDNKLYLYKDYIDLVIDTNGLYVDNRPMNNRKLIAHKGLTNEIFFNIRNRDRKLQNVFSEILTATLINPTTKRRFFYKVLEHTSEVGIAKLVLDEGDLRDISAGLYTIYIARRKSDSLDYPMFTDQNSNLVFQIEISEQIDQSPVDTQLANSFTQTASVGSGDPANVFVTSALYGNQDRNFSQALHSLAIYNTYYTGNLTVQGSCIEGTPNSDDASTDWFDLETLELNSKHILYGNVIVSESFAGNNVSNGNIVSSVTSFILTDKENSNGQINFANIDVSSATTVTDVVTLINNTSETNSNVVASVVTSDQSNIRSYSIKIVGNDFELSGNSDTLTNLGLSVNRFQSNQANIIQRNYQVNTNWIRVKHTPSSGTLDQIQLRN